MQYTASHLSRQTYEKATTVRNIANEFPGCGIWPVSKEVFSGFEFSVSFNLNIVTSTDQTDISNYIQVISVAQLSPLPVPKPQQHTSKDQKGQKAILITCSPDEK